MCGLQIPKSKGRTITLARAVDAIGSVTQGSECEERPGLSASGEANLFKMDL